MKHNNSIAAKAVRRTEAEQRLSRWQSLTYEQQLAELANRRGNCTKQVARIQFMIKVRDNL
jgi:hypothetical protein